MTYEASSFSDPPRCGHFPVSPREDQGRRVPFGGVWYSWGKVVVDWDRVCELRSEIGIADFDEVLQLFLDETDEAIAKLGSASSAAAMEAGLHCLKGSALNLGLSDLARLCQDEERKAAAGTPCGPISAVTDCYHQSRDVLVKGLRKLDAA